MRYDYIKVTALQMGQENPCYVNIDKIVSVGSIITYKQVPPAEDAPEGTEPSVEEVKATVINVAGAPAIFVKEAAEEVMNTMKGGSK